METELNVAVNELEEHEVRARDDDGSGRRSVRALKATVSELSDKLTLEKTRLENTKAALLESQNSLEESQSSLEFANASTQDLEEGALAHNKTLAEYQKLLKENGRLHASHIKALQGRSTKNQSKKANALIEGTVFLFVFLSRLSTSARLYIRYFW
jgi:septal ring factor EnvC (AmiA/AmiB activator)